MHRRACFVTLCQESTDLFCEVGRRVTPAVSRLLAVDGELCGGDRGWFVIEDTAAVPWCGHDRDPGGRSPPRTWSHSYVSASPKAYRAVDPGGERSHASSSEHPCSVPCAARRGCGSSPTAAHSCGQSCSCGVTVRFFLRFDSSSG